jgi:hypothetical protein
MKQRSIGKWRGHLAMVWGQPTQPLGRLACYLPIYKSHSFLSILSLQHNTKSAPKFEIPISNFIVEFLLSGSSVGVRKSVRKLECESSAKILREREIGAAKI